MSLPALPSVPISVPFSQLFLPGQGGGGSICLRTSASPAACCPTGCKKNQVRSGPLGSRGKWIKALASYSHSGLGVSIFEAYQCSSQVAGHLGSGQSGSSSPFSKPHVYHPAERGFLPWEVIIVLMVRWLFFFLIPSRAIKASHPEKGKME